MFKPSSGAVSGREEAELVKVHRGEYLTRMKASSHPAMRGFETPSEHHCVDGRPLPLL